MIDLIFNFKPSGGSVTILSDFYKIPNGNLLVGCVVSHNLKSLCGFCINSRVFSKCPFSQLVSKWQF
jgi:hypothetical protein